MKTLESIFTIIMFIIQASGLRNLPVFARLLAVDCDTVWPPGVNVTKLFFFVVVIKAPENKLVPVRCFQARLMFEG